MIKIFRRRQGGASASLAFFDKGFTLIEILIVLAIAAVVMGSAVVMLGGNASGKMRSESARLITLIKYLYNEATLKNEYYRIVFDIDEQRYLIESSQQPFSIVMADDEAEAIRKKNEETNDGELDSDASPPSGASSFVAVDSESIEPRTLPEQVRLADVFVFHDKDKLTEGKAYLYFFPRGQTEFAVIHLSDEEGENFFTLIVNPLTGYVEVRPEYVEHSDILDGLFEER